VRELQGRYRTVECQRSDRKVSRKPAETQASQIQPLGRGKKGFAGLGVGEQGVVTLNEKSSFAREEIKQWPSKVKHCGCTVILPQDFGLHYQNVQTHNALDTYHTSTNICQDTLPNVKRFAEPLETKTKTRILI
jgi:hypothetical protein